MMNTGFVRSIRNQPMATDVAADEVALGEERKGYMVWISSGNHKQSFSKKQSASIHDRVTGAE